MSFRKYGGLNYAATNNYVSNNVTSANTLLVTKQIGENESIIIVKSELDVYNNVKVFGNVDISGNTDISGNLFVFRDATVNGNFDVSGTSLLHGHVAIGTPSVSANGPYALDVSGNTYISGNLDVSNNLDVSGNAYIIGNLDVSGTSWLKSHVAIGTSSVSADGPYALDVSGNTYISGNLDVSNNLDVSGNTYIIGNLDVSGTSLLYGHVAMYDGLDVSGNTYISGNLDVSNNLDVSGNAIIYGDLDVCGNLYAAKLNFTSASIENLDVSNNLTVHGNASFSNLYIVGSPTTFGYVLDVSGDVYISGNLDVSGTVYYSDSDVSGDLVVHGFSFLGKNVTMLSDLDVCGNTTIYGNLDVSGSSMFNGDIDLSCNSILHTNTIYFCDGTSQSTASTNIVYSPPAVDISYSSNSSQILFTWPIPTYNNTGSPFPYTLTNIFAYLYADISSSYNSYNILPTDASGYVYDVSAIVLSNLPQTSYQNGYIDTYLCIDGITRNVFYYYDASFSNMYSNTYNNLTLWYTNNYPYPNVGDTSYSIFSSSGTPGTVYFQSPFQNPNSPNDISLNCYVNQVDILNPSTTAVISNYKISIGGYDASSSTIRYPNTQTLHDNGPTSDITVTGTADTSFSTFFPLGLNTTYSSPIFPSSIYTFYVSAQNNTSNTNYGLDGSFNYTTEAVSTPSPTLPTSTNPLFNPSNITYTNNNNNIYLVSENSPVQYDVIDISSINTSNSFCSVAGSFIVPVQSANNLGLSGENYDQTSIYLTISGEVVVGNTSNYCPQFIHGFDTTLTLTNSNPYATTYTSSQSGITLTTPVYDYYTTTGTQDYSCNQGFYLMAPPVMDISSSILSSTNNLYTATLKSAQNPTYAGSTAATYDASYNFYCDNINSTPNYVDLGGFSITSTNIANYYKQVSGIYVMYISPTFTITDLSLSNMGDYFYRSPLVSYVLSGGATTIAQETNLDNVTGYNDVSFNETISITNDGISGSLNTTQWYDNITLYDISYQNIYGYNTKTFTDISISTIVDYQSYTLAYNTIPQSIYSAVTNTNGYRVWSAPSSTGFDPPGVVPNLYITSGSSTPNGTATSDEGYWNIQYNNYWDISNLNTTNTYGVSSELLIANGHFTTNNEYYLDYSGNYSGGIQNTVNYSQSNMYTTGYRYATFAWIITSGNTFSISMQFLNNNIYLNDIGYAYFVNGSPLNIFYRLESQTNPSDFGVTSPGATTYYPNTVWISINSVTSYSGSTVNVYQNSNNVYYAAPTNTFSSTSYVLTMNVSLPPNINFDYSIIFYLRIGMPDGYDGFSSVTSEFTTSTS